ncbi:MAG: hypothetical protein ACLGPM_09755 [Acidobacteriota bacterium]
MDRKPWFELHDSPRFPGFLRDMVTDGLEHTWNTLGIYRCIAPLLRRAVAESGARQVVDLCSGGGGPWLSLAPDLVDDAGQPLPVTLTDKFPNLSAFERTRAVSGGRISFCAEPVDASAVGDDLRGFRTIFSAFHHFTPEAARAMLADAFEKREGIGVFELAQPRAKTIALCFGMPALNWLLTPGMRPLGWRRLLWTYLLPVIPFTLWMDGILSCLRSYSQADMRELVRGLEAEDYRWQIGEAGTGKARVAYLVGIAARQDASN